MSGGHIMMNDLVQLRQHGELRPRVYMVANINEASFHANGGWKRYLDIEAVPSGGGIYDVDEEKLQLVASDKALQAMRKTPNDLPDPREKLFGR